MPLSSPNQAFFGFLFTLSSPGTRSTPSPRVSVEADDLFPPDPIRRCITHEVYPGAGPRAPVVFAGPAPDVSSGGEAPGSQGAHEAAARIDDLEPDGRFGPAGDRRDIERDGRSPAR